MLIHVRPHRKRNTKEKKDKVETYQNFKGFFFFLQAPVRKQ